MHAVRFVSWFVDWMLIRTKSGFFVKREAQERTTKSRNKLGFLVNS